MSVIVVGLFVRVIMLYRSGGMGIISVNIKRVIAF